MLALALGNHITQQNLVLAGFRQMSTALESLEQQYAAEVLKLDADEHPLRRLERGIRGVAEPTGQCSVGTHVQIRFENRHSALCLLCLILSMITSWTAFLHRVNAAYQPLLSIEGLLWDHVYTQLTCILTLLLRTCIAKSQPPLC